MLPQRHLPDTDRGCGFGFKRLHSPWDQLPAAIYAAKMDILDVVLDLAFGICTMIGLGFVLHEWRASRNEPSRQFADTQ
jgi:hypothetical protein